MTQEHRNVPIYPFEPQDVCDQDRSTQRELERLVPMSFYDGDSPCLPYQEIYEYSTCHHGHDWGLEPRLARHVLCSDRFNPSRPLYSYSGH